MTATIDTLEVAKELKAAGFDQAQAEALARLARRSQDLDLSGLATKTDLSELRAATKSDLAELRAATKSDLAELRVELKEAVSELRVEIADTKAEILRWMVVTQLAVGGFIIAAIKLVH